MTTIISIKPKTLVLVVFPVLALVFAAWPVQKVAASQAEVVVPLGNLLVFKFLDADANGIYDPGESPCRTGSSASAPAVPPRMSTASPPGVACPWATKR